MIKVWKCKQTTQLLKLENSGLSPVPRPPPAVPFNGEIYLHQERQPRWHFGSSSSWHSRALVKRDSTLGKCTRFCFEAKSPVCLHVQSSGHIMDCPLYSILFPFVNMTRLKILKDWSFRLCFRF